MRHRLHGNIPAEHRVFDNEDELIEALSCHGWDLQQRAAREVLESRARRFELARRSRMQSGRPRTAAG